MRDSNNLRLLQDLKRISLYNYPKNTSHRSADKVIMENSRQDYLDRFKLAVQLNENPIDGIRANALLVFSVYYRDERFFDPDYEFAKQCLKESAELGHSQACFEMARKHLGKNENAKALYYVKRGLEKIDDQSFNSTLTSHNQGSIKNTLLGLKKICQN